MSDVNALVRSSVLVGLRHYLQSRGPRIEPLLEEVGLSPDHLDNPLLNLPLGPVCEFFERAATELSDPCFAVNAGLEARPTPSGLLSHLAMSAPTVRDALRVAAGYVEVFATGISARYEECDGVAVGTWVLPSSVRGPRTQFNLFVATLLVLRLRAALGANWKPLAFEFDHRQPGCPELLARVFGPRLKFDRSENRMTIDAASLSRPMPMADPVVYAIHEDLARRWLQEVGVPSSISGEARQEIQRTLQAGQPELDRIAAALGLAPRSLQRRLQLHGTTFEKLVSDTRAELAGRLLLETDLPVSEIAAELGYAEVSAFTRAARRWFNMSPRAYRQQMRGKRAGAVKLGSSG